MEDGASLRTIRVGWILGGIVCRRADVDKIHGQALCSELGWWYATARGRPRVERESADVTTNFGCAIQEEVL